MQTIIHQCSFYLTKSRLTTSCFYYSSLQPMSSLDSETFIDNLATITKNLFTLDCIPLVPANHGNHNIVLIVPSASSSFVICQTFLGFIFKAKTISLVRATFFLFRKSQTRFLSPEYSLHIVTLFSILYYILFSLYFLRSTF